MKSSDKKSCIILILLLIVKILLIPTYRSTDFDVHRNWLAITRNLPLEEWYYDDVNGTTVHTLDYPPSFAYFEFMISQNHLTNHLISKDWLKYRCFERMGDHENVVDMDCVIFQRLTVIASDLILFFGVQIMSSALSIRETQRALKHDYRMLVVMNSGLLLLDHIHFQYNGMLLGLLLSSLGCILLSMQVTNASRAFILELSGAIIFALLLTFKHLYMTLAPVYFFYLLRRRFSKQKSSGDTYIVRIKRFLCLGASVIFTLVLPFVPFAMHGKEHIQQILNRMFPFQRGLCHDYWAGNVWALYLGTEKMVRFIYNKILGADNEIRYPDITPFQVAILLFVSIVPAMKVAWKVANPNIDTVVRQNMFLMCIVYSSLSSFMLGYHVHEKAIMTAIVPMTFLSFRSKRYARLFLRLCTVGHFGLLPLIYRPQEFLLKNLLFLIYLNISYLILSNSKFCQEDRNEESLMHNTDQIGLSFLLFLGIYGDILHPLIFGTRMEFLPLMMISLTCALYLCVCWREIHIIISKSIP